MQTITRLGRRGRGTSGETLAERLGGADAVPGAVSTLVTSPAPAPEVGEGTGAPSRAALESSTGPAPDLLDPFAADRFTVEPDEDEEPDLPETPTQPEGEGEPQTTPWRLFVRLLLVVALSLLAFHHSVASAARSIASGSVLVYLLVVPLLAVLASAAAGRRPGYLIASSFRRRDVVLGATLCLAAVGATTLLGPGLSGVYAVWRADLLMLWLFLVGATTLCFGLRQVLRSWPFWAVLVLLWPFPLRIVNAAVGDATGGAVLLSLVVLAITAYGHRPDDRPRWQVLGVVAGTAALALLLSDPLDHPTRIEWPSVAAAAVIGVWWWAGRARVEPVHSVTERRPRGTVVVLVGLATLGLLVLPPAPVTRTPSTPQRITALSLGPLVVPGYRTTATVPLAQQQHYFGRSSTWQRVQLQEGEAAASAPDGREVVVDVLSTPRPQVLTLYPVVTTYPLGTLSMTPDAETDLGHGVTGQVFRGEDADDGIAYTLLTFSWTLPVDMGLLGGYTGPPAPLTQRITLISLDDRSPGAPFPQPGNATLDGVRAAFAQVADARQTRTSHELTGDELLLGDVARRLVDQRLTGG